MSATKSAAASDAPGPLRRVLVRLAAVAATANTRANVTTAANQGLAAS
ncbi:MAG: hypothetical protein ACYSUY_07510 [Planctomycetota bacterium]